MKYTKLLSHVGLLVAAGSLWIPSTDVQAGQGPMPSICNRACWAARAPTCGITQMGSLTRAIIHHTAGASDYSTDLNTSKAKMRAVQNLHINNGWCDIAYHFLVDAAGNIFEGRSGALNSLPRGTHDACNNNSFGFTALGYYHPPYNHNFTAASRSAMEAVIAWRMPSDWSPYGSGTYCSANVGTLDGHYRVKATACPGDVIIPQLPGIRDGVNARKNPAPSGPPPEPVIATGNYQDGRLAAFFRGSDNALWYTVQQTVGSTAWTGHIRLGAYVDSVPAVGQNLDGRLEVFFRGGDNALWHFYQTSPNGGWSYETRRGAYLASMPVVERSGDGRLHVFFKGGDNAIWYFYQTSPGGAWSYETRLGAFSASKPAVGRNADGNLDVFFNGGDNAMWHFLQTPGGPNNGWSWETRMGATFYTAPVAGRNADGRQEVFFWGGDNALWHFYQTSINGGWSYETRRGAFMTSLPAWGQNADGRQAVFFRGGDNNALWHFYQTAVNGGWSYETRLGAYLASGPSVGRNADGRLEVFFRGGDNALWRFYQTAPNGGWSYETSMGGYVSVPNYR